MTTKHVSEECVMDAFTLIVRALAEAGARDPLDAAAMLTARVVDTVERHLSEDRRPVPEPSPNRQSPIQGDPTVSKTTIEWTDIVWNPTRGCTKISPGCAHCYAETFAKRFVGVPGNAYELGFTPRTVPEKLAEPFNWTKPLRVFVNSMSDLFHEAFPDDYIAKVVDVMAATPWHTYQVLTKRHDRLRELLSGTLRRAGRLENVFWGVSVENRKHGLPRVDALRDTPAALRFLSVEPLLEDLGEFDLTGIHWVICGGESGRRPRPLDPDWVRRLRDRCEAELVPFFFKQWGGTNKKKAGRLLEGETYDDMPEPYEGPVPSRRDLQALAMQLFPETAGRTALPMADDDEASCKK